MIITIPGYEHLKATYEKKGYRFFDSGEYNVNIFGIRANDLTPNVFNDIIGIAYRDKFNRQMLMLFKATTDPGSHYLGKNMGHPQGTAVLCPNQYRSALMLGKHKGQYEALVQSPKAQFKVWRDNNKDGKLDLKGRKYTNVTGLNLHTTSFINDTQKVGAYSAGCQVVQDSEEFLIAMPVIKKSAELYGNSFTYTLFEEFDFLPY